MRPFPAASPESICPPLEPQWSASSCFNGAAPRRTRRFVERYGGVETTARLQ